MSLTQASNGDAESLRLSFQDLSINSSTSTEYFSSVLDSGISSSSKSSDGNFGGKVVKLDLEGVDCVESEKTSLSLSLSLSSSSCSKNVDVNEVSFRSVCPSKPHKGNDLRWDAIQCVKAKDGELGLGHFRLLKKLGFGDIGSVYLAELRGVGCLFAMKVMDKGMLAERKKLMRAQTEREILGLLDHPFLPSLYSHFETDKFSCLLIEYCSGGDLHLLRQRQLGKHFSELAARFVLSSNSSSYI